MTEPPTTEAGRRFTARPTVNWSLALLTLLGAGAVVYYALGAALSVAECASVECTNLGPSVTGYAIMLYGAPVVALATIAVTAFTAKHRFGVVVPLAGWLLLLFDVAAIAAAFRHH